MKYFKVKLSEIDKIDDLFLTTRVASYFKIIENKKLFPLEYFIEGDSDYRIGQLKTDEYQEKGKIPIVDQSKELIAGYSDDSELVYTGKLPVVVFGDHTTIFKYVDFPFIQGADGIKIILPNKNVVNPKFFYYLLTHFGVPKRGYNRHFSILKRLRYPFIPKAFQDKVITEIEYIERDIKSLKSKIKEDSEIINKIFVREFGYAENLRKEFGKGMTAGTQKLKEKIKRVFKMYFTDINKSQILRFSARFHNPYTKKLMDVLKKNELIKVEEVITEPIHRGKEPEITEEGNIYAVKTGQLRNSFIDLNKCEFVSREFYDNQKNAQIRKGDILLASTGKVSLGKIDRVDFEDEAIADGHVSIIRVDKNKYNLLFFVYFFRSILGVFQIERDFTGATNQIELYPSEINNFLIPRLPLVKQQRIVEEIKNEIDKQERIKKQIETYRAEIEQIINKTIKNKISEISHA